MGSGAMAVDHIVEAIDRLQQDSRLRLQYRQDPDQALAIYQLSPDERRALKTGDGFELELMGLGQKWSEFVETLCGPYPGP
jgi:3'-phosphoadenosine 5'-phosphosulfate sulfotransferase